MNLFENRTAYHSGNLNKVAYAKEMHKSHQSLFEYAEFIRDTDIASIEIVDGNVIMTTRSKGIKMLSDQIDERLVPVTILNFGKYEESESLVLSQLIGENFNIFDVGANIGWYSLNLAKTYPKSHLYAFEPIPHSFNYLERNIALNKLENITTFNCGLSDKDGIAVFWFYPEASGASSRANILGMDSVQKTPCLLRRLDDVVDELDVAVDFIKCDTEGSELFVFKGGVNTIKYFKPIVFSELLRKWAAKFNYHPNQVIDFFTDLGYLCFTAKDQHLEKFERMDENTVETNFFFLHSQKHAAQISKLTASPS
jgi:FkbM family methyltransferase